MEQLQRTRTVRYDTTDDNVTSTGITPCDCYERVLSAYSRQPCYVLRPTTEKLKSARIWGTSATFEGQTVTRDHVLADRDIVELHV